MKFRLTHDIPKVAERLRRAPVTMRREMASLLDALGVQALSLSQMAYREKARGGRGSDGITWKPLKKSTITRKNRRGKPNAKRKTTASGKARPTMLSAEIGVDTGLQRASASPGFINAGGGNIFERGDTSVTVGYGRKYSKHFDAVRPLMPSQLPQRWEEHLNGIIKRWAERVLGEVIP